MEYSHGRGVSVALVMVFHGESHSLSDIPLYLWIVFVNREVHEDPEKFTIIYIGPFVSKPVVDIP